MKNRDLTKTQNLRLRYVLLFLSYCFATSNLWAQAQIDDPTAAQLRVAALNVIPPTPTAQQFQLYGNVPVNTAVGVPNIEIPIHTLSIDGVNVPISLSYHASGIRVNELATDVGLKWTLNAGGMVYRSINGHEDEEGNRFFEIDPVYFSSDMWSGACTDFAQSSLADVSANVHDLTPDNFGYTIPGHSGSFFYNKERKLHQTVASSNEIIWVDKLNFLIRDDKGVEYHFGGTGYTEFSGTETQSMGGSIDGSRSGTGRTGWKLRKIVTRNGREIKFYYKNYSLRYGFVTGHTSKSYDAHVSCYPCMDDSDKKTSNFGSYTQFDYNTLLLESIVSDNAVIKFTHELDASLDTWQQKLTSIDIQYKDNTPLQKVKFEYISSGGKLILKKVFWDAAGAAVYNFNYADLMWLPSIGSFSQDIFGFYNGAGNTTHMIPVDPQFAHQFKWGSSADRSVNENNITSGVLNEVQYPTGGKTKFYYEANKEGEEYAPGLRVSTVEDLDINGTLLKKVKYEYSGLSGQKRTRGGYTRNFKSEPRDCAYFLFSSNEIYKTDRPYTGYYYQKVVIRNVDKNDRVESVTEENYVSYLDDHTFKPYLSRRKLFTNDNRLVQEQYLEYTSKENPEVVGAISAGSTYTSNYCSTTFPDQCLNLYDGLVPQKYRSFITHLFRETNTETFEDGSVITTVNNYRYNDFQQLKLKEYYNTAVPGDIHKQEYKYPTDYSRTISLIDQLCNKNMTSLLVDYREYAPGSILKNGAVLMYDGKGNVTSKYSLTPDAPSWSPDAIIPAVGSKLEQQGIWSVDGKLIQTVDAGEISTAYLWSYNNNYLVAVAVNARKDQVLYYSFEEDGTTAHGAKAGSKSWDARTTGKVITKPTAAGTYLISYYKKELGKWVYYSQPFTTSSITLTGIIDEVRVYPVGAQMSTYTYKPGVGVSSVTDTNGQTSYYEYDNFGRLLYISDDEGNTVQQYQYKYAIQAP